MARESAAHVFWSDMRGRSPAFSAAPVADVCCGGCHRGGFPGFRLRCGPCIRRKATGLRSITRIHLDGALYWLNLGAWAAPANPSYEAIGFPSAGFDLVPNGGGQNAGVTGGVQAGYNYQIGSVVPGVEADFDYLRQLPWGGTFAAPPVYEPYGTGSYSLSGGCSSYAGSLRGHLGYAFDRVLVYGTGGIAFGGNRNPGSVILNPIAPGHVFAAGASSSARTKYVFGAGVEHALSDHWLARAEYLYDNLGQIDQFFLNGAGQIYGSTQFNQNHIFRLGLDYKFDNGTAAAGPPPAPSGEAPPAMAEDYSAHGQITFVPQGYPGFPAAYSGPQSLPPHANVAETLAVDAYLGLVYGKARPFISIPRSTKVSALATPSASRDFRTHCLHKVGASQPYERNQRYFLRQFIGLGGETEEIDGGPNQLAGPVDLNRLTFTVGKYSVVDIFDDNKYAHDPVSTFLSKPHALRRPIHAVAVTSPSRPRQKFGYLEMCPALRPMFAAATL